MHFLVNEDLLCKVRSQPDYLCLKAGGNEGSFFLISFGLALSSSISQTEYQVYNNHLEIIKKDPNKNTMHYVTRILLLKQTSLKIWCLAHDVHVQTRTVSWVIRNFLQHRLLFQSVRCYLSISLHHCEL